MGTELVHLFLTLRVVEPMKNGCYSLRSATTMNSKLLKPLRMNVWQLTSRCLVIGMTIISFAATISFCVAKGPSSTTTDLRAFTYESDYSGNTYLSVYLNNRITSFYIGKTSLFRTKNFNTLTGARRVIIPALTSWPVRLTSTTTNSNIITIPSPDESLPSRL